MKSEISQLLNEAQAVRVKDVEVSIKIATKALELSLSSKDLHSQALALSRLGFYQMIIGSYKESLTTSSKAKQLFEELGDDKGKADTLYTIGSIFYKQDSLHLGLRNILECLTIYSKYNDLANLAKCHKVVGTIYECFGDLDNAIAANLRAVEAAEAIGDLNMKSNAFNPLSGLYLNQGRLEEAALTIEEAIAIKTNTGDIRGLAFSLYGRAKIYAAKDQFELAEKDFLEAIRIHKSVGEVVGIPLGLLKLGTMYARQGFLKRAEEMVSEAFVHSKKYGIRVTLQKSIHLLYRVAKQNQDHEKALQYLEIFSEEAESNQKFQTQQIVDCYDEIGKMEAQVMEKKREIEHVEMLKKKTQAEYAAQVKSDFLSTMSHEIRTPLNAIITISNLLKEGNDKEENTLIESLRFASNNLLLLVNDVLDFSKLESAKVELESKSSNLPKLLKNIHQTYAGLAKSKGLEFQLELDEQLETCYEIDSAKLSQILGNLLSNAIKFTDKGSVKLTASVKSKHDEVDDIHFEISDTGMGITDDFKGTIFQSFAQPKSVTTKKSSGSGLGLAIVKKLVSLFGSTINFSSKENEGSSFFFTIGLRRSQEESAIPLVNITEIDQLRILLVEDNALNTLVAKKLLKEWGAKAESAVNGEEAVSMASEKKYDLILMDIHMPLMDGYEAAELIRQGQQNRNTPIWALTADIMAHTQIQHKNNFTGYLRKPIEQADLKEVLLNVPITGDVSI